MRYFVLHNKRQYGPFEEIEIQELLAAGILTFNDPVAPEGTSKFQPMANTDLIFTREAVPANLQTEFIFQNTVSKTQPVFATTRVAATLEEPAASLPGTESSFSLSNKFWMCTQKTCQKLPEFILTKILPRKHLEKTILGKALVGFISKIYAWLTLLGVSLLVQQFFFSKIFNALFKLIFPDSGPTGLSFVGQMAEMFIVLIACTYTLMTMALMTINGAAGLYDYTAFSLKKLFFNVQPKILKFCFIISEFSLIVIVMEMATVLLPDRIQFIGKYLVILAFLAVTHRLLAVPFAAILEEVGVFEAHRVSTVLMRRQFKPVFYYGLGYTLIESGIDLLARNYHYCIALKYLLQLFTLIFATYYYKDLSNKALIRKHRLNN